MVDATYDLRPPPDMLAWYLVPFLLAGFLWTPTDPSSSNTAAQTLIESTDSDCFPRSRTLADDGAAASG